VIGLLSFDIADKKAKRKGILGMYQDFTFYSIQNNSPIELFKGRGS